MIKPATAMVPHAFRPRWTNPFYIMRNELYRSIREYGGQLTGRLLDFGCGTKPYQSLFSVTEYVGIDLGKRRETARPADEFYDGKTLPFSDDSFDSVLSTEVFEHVFNLEEALAELHRVLRPGGKILITCPFVWELHEVPYDFARYTPFALRSILERQGFRVLAAQGRGHSLIAIAQLFQLYVFYTLVEPLLKRRMTYGLGRGLSILLGGTCNLTAMGLARLLPTRSEIYLSNLVLAEKSATGKTAFEEHF